MEHYYFNSTSLTQIYDYGSYYENEPYDTKYYEFNYYKIVAFIMYVLTCIIIAIGLPLTLLAIYALYSLVRSDHVAPIYVINLLVPDLIQFCCMIVEVAEPEDWIIHIIFNRIHLSGLFASVYFMVCVALERYLFIAHPLWYRCRQNIKTSVVVCVLVWVVTLVCAILLYFCFDYEVTNTILAIVLLLPFPLLIFFLVGTLRALSAAISVPSDEKRRIVGILILVLLIYTLLFLPSIIWLLEARFNYTLIYLFLMLMKFSPLANLVLYVFMRKGAIDKLLASVCCCRMDSSDISSSSV